MGERLTLSWLSERIKEPPATTTTPTPPHRRLLCSRPCAPEQLCVTTERLLLKNIFETFDLDQSGWGGRGGGGQTERLFHFSFFSFRLVSVSPCVGLGRHGNVCLKFVEFIW